MITQEYLKSILHYDPSDGKWTWIRDSKRTWKGRPAGSLSLGYLRIAIDQKLYRSARLAVLYMTGEWPDYEVDHINGIKDDDRWCNLRKADRRNNAMNIGLTSANTSGYKGVYYNKRQKMWLAQIRIDGVKTSIGFYDTAEKAGKAYQEYALKRHKEFAKW
jgi:hypothetical protein